MKLLSMTAMTEKGLNKKVNAFLEEHPFIDIIKFDYQIGYSGFGVGILYKESKSLLKSKKAYGPITLKK